MADVFISYSKSHASVTRRLASELEALGISVWWDTELVAGESYRHRIQKEIADASAAIVIWTPDSIASEFVISEAGRAHAQRKLIQVRTADVAVKDVPPPFDVNHVALIDDRKAIMGALQRLGVVEPAALTEAPAWQQPVQQPVRRGAGRIWLASAVAGLVVTAGAAGLIAVGSRTADVASPPLVQATTAVTPEDPAKLAITVAGELLRQVSTGFESTALLDSDVRLGQRGLMSRVDAAAELRKLGQRSGRISCRLDSDYVELRSPEQASSGFRAKLTVICDLAGRGGKTETKRFPLEIEVVRKGDTLQISGMWQPEEMVLWQRRERGK